MRHVIMGAVLVCALGIPAAHAADTDCIGFSWPMDREAALFAAPPAEPVKSGTTLTSLPETAVRIALLPQGEAAYPVAPDRAPKYDDAKGGWISLPAPSSAGTYQVTLNTQGWVDVIQAGQPLPNAGFSSDANCKPMHKSIRFELKAEPITLQFADFVEGEVTLTILPASNVQDAPPVTAASP